MAELYVSKKEFLETQIENCQKNIWILQIENRLLERGKISSKNDKLLAIENAIVANKNKIDYLQKRLEIVKDIYKEEDGEIKLRFK